MIKFPYNILVIVFSAATLLFSLMMILGLATDPNAVDGNVLAILIMTPFAIAPLLAIYVALKKPTPIPFSIDAGTERKILQMVKRHNGRLTPTHLAMDSPLSIEQATQALADFEQRGFAYSTVTAHGGTEYVFPDLLGSTDQSNQFDQHNKPDELDELYNQIRDYERSTKTARAHVEHSKSTHKN